MLGGMWKPNKAQNSVLRKQRGMILQLKMMIRFTDSKLEFLALLRY
jgi:hypothetical protein